MFLKRTMTALAAAILLSGAPALFSQTADEVKAQAKAAVTDADVTYGRIKEFTPGQKVLIDIDNAPDKEFDLASKDVSVKLPSGLKIGDTVKVAETDVMGKTKSVIVTKHSGGGVAHGDKDPHKP